MKPFADCADANFDGMVVTNPLWWGADLRGATFRGASVRISEFLTLNWSPAQLYQTGINTTDLSDSIWTDSSVYLDMERVLFDRVDMAGAYGWVRLHGTSATANNANFNGFTGSVWFTGVVANEASFRNATLFQWGEFGSSDMRGSHFEGASLPFSSSESDFTDTHWEGSTLTSGTINRGSVFDRAVFDGAELIGVRFNQFPTFVGASFVGTVFRACFVDEVDLSTADLTGAVWINTRCPDGTNSDANGGTCIGHL